MDALASRYVRMGQHVWLLLATIATEVLIIVKWAEFPQPWPTRSKLFLGTGAFFLVAYPMVKFGIPELRRYLLERGRRKEKVKAL
jgi:phosphatidylserine synthase 2